MTGKDFLFSLNVEKLFKKYYKDYYEPDIIFNAKAEKEGFDKQKTIRAAFDNLLEELKNVKITPSNKYYLLPEVAYDFEIEEDLSYKIETLYDVSLLKLESITINTPIKEVNSREEIPDKLLFESYSLMFVPWEELLSYEMFYIPEDENVKYGVAAFFLHELSWFGYDKKTVEENMEKEMKKLDEAIEESKNPENLKTLDLEKLFSDLGIEPPSEEEKALRNKLTEEIIVKSYNEKVKMYNKYFIGRQL